MWPKMGNSNISLRKFIITSILKGFDHKKQIFWEALFVQVQYFGKSFRYVLEILYQDGKRVKTIKQIKTGIFANPHPPPTK